MARKRIGSNKKEAELIVPQRVTIEISKEAADCLAFWAKSEFYGPTISEAIINQQEAWICREYHARLRHPTLQELVNGQWDSLEDQFKV